MPAEFMASKVDVTYNTRVAHVRLIKDRTKWMLFTDDDTVDAEFDSVVLALPAPQLIHVLTTKYWSAAAILSAASNVVFSPCTALVAVFPQGTMLAEFELDYAIAQKSHVIASLSRETSKPRVANSYYSADSVSSDDVDVRCRRVLRWFLVPCRSAVSLLHCLRGQLGVFLWEEGAAV